MDRSQMDTGVFFVIALGIVYDPQSKMILIGRREQDPHIPELTRSFPGGTIDHKHDIENTLCTKIQDKTGIAVHTEKIIFSKIYPENHSLLALYYLCTPTSGELRSSSDFADVRWIPPTEVEKYFTTSLHPTVLAYLKTLV